MTGYGGFVFRLDEPERAERFTRAIARPGATFSDVVSAPDWGVQTAELFLIAVDSFSIDSLDDDPATADDSGGLLLHGAALMRRGNRAATYKWRVNFTNYVPFDPPVPLAEIEQMIGGALRTHLVRSSSGDGSRVPPRTWAALMDALTRVRPDLTSDLSALEGLRDFSGARFGARPGAQIVALERDATNLALRISGKDPARMLAWRPPVADEPVAPFLAGLTHARASRVLEDRMIEHDMGVFGDWNIIQRDVRGVAVFESRGRRRLTVFNANRTSVENTLGVDLLYYVHRYRAYLLVQYKRMEREGTTLCYRPRGENYQAELARMQALAREFTALPEGAGLAFPLPAYRLHAGACFFKLCPAEVVDTTSTAMLPGMYLPLDYWECIVGSEATLGPRGGVRVTFESAGRHLTNTLFVDLAQDGWIGSRLAGTDAITRYVTAALEGQRSVTFAADMGEPEPG